MPQLIRLDVSELEPPEPMQVILEALRQLAPDSALRVFHRRQPFPLYTLLQESGYSWHCVKLATERFAIFIWPENNPALTDFCHHCAAEEQKS